MTGKSSICSTTTQIAALSWGHPHRAWRPRSHALAGTKRSRRRLLWAKQPLPEKSLVPIATNRAKRGVKRDRGREKLFSASILLSQPFRTSFSCSSNRSAHPALSQMLIARFQGRVTSKFEKATSVPFWLTSMPTEPGCCKGLVSLPIPTCWLLTNNVNEPASCSTTLTTFASCPL